MTRRVTRDFHSASVGAPLRTCTIYVKAAGDWVPLHVMYGEVVPMSRSFQDTFWGKLPDDCIRGCNELFVMDEEG